MKKTFNIIITFTLTSFMFSNCAQPKIRKDQLDLEKLHLDFNVDAFYADEIKKAENYQEKVEELRENIRNDVYKTEKEVEKAENKIFELLDVKWIEIDTLYKDPYNYDKTQDKPIGIQYNMRSWGSNDSLAYYGKVYFKKIDMMQSLDSAFMALVALNESEGEDTFKQLLADIEQKYGKAKVKEFDFFGAYYVYYWELEDRLLAISSKYDDKENTLALGVEVTENDVKIDTAKQPTINTNLFILNNTYKQDSIVKHLTSGDWLYFREILEQD